MKKLLTGIILLGLFFVMPFTVFAAGTCTQSLTMSKENASQQRAVGEHIVDCTADAADGSFPATAMSSGYRTVLVGYCLYQVDTDVGAVTPSAWSLTFTRAVGLHSVDLLGGLGATRSASASVSVNITAPASYSGRCIGCEITNGAVITGY